MNTTRFARIRQHLQRKRREAALSLSLLLLAVVAQLCEHTPFRPLGNPLFHLER